MAAAPVNLMNAGHFYTNLAKPIDLNLNFIVDVANGNGLGVRSVKSNGYVKNVFMHTSAVLAGSGNPNPAVGYAVIQLAGNFNRYIGGFSGQIAALASSNLTSTTAGNPYVITSIGSTTLAQFQAAGFPKGMAPAVGASFIAIATGSLGGSGTLGAPAISPILNLQIVGDPSLTLSNSNSAANGGGQIIVAFVGATSVSNPTPIVVTPADNTIVGMTIRVDGSSVNVDGL